MKCTECNQPFEPKEVVSGDICSECLADKYIKGVNPSISDLFELPPEQLDQVVSTLSSSEIQKLEKEADQIAQTAGYLSGYLSVRGGDGTGDHGHEKGLKFAGSRHKAIRKALGYNG